MYGKEILYLRSMQHYVRDERNIIHISEFYMLSFDIIKQNPEVTIVSNTLFSKRSIIIHAGGENGLYPMHYLCGNSY